MEGGSAEDLGALLGATGVEELGGGYQSRAFRVVLRDGSTAVAKVFDATSVDRAELDARLDVLVALADLDPRVCRPLAVDGEVVAVTGAGRAYVVCFEHADGRPPDPADPADAARMGTELATLHRSMRRVPSTRLPLVATLRGASAETLSLGGAIQLLHGDFHAGNLRLGPAGLRIFDLDDCGHGPPAFDVANALYMVRFDSIVEGTPAVYESFERSFVTAYARTRGEPFPSAVLTHFIDRRVAALAGWIDDLASAPVGIRAASPEWLATLRAFVETYRSAAR